MGGTKECPRANADDSTAFTGIFPHVVATLPANGTTLTTAGSPGKNQNIKLLKYRRPQIAGAHMADKKFRPLVQDPKYLPLTSACVVKNGNATNSGFRLGGKPVDAVTVEDADPLQGR